MYTIIRIGDNVLLGCSLAINTLIKSPTNFGRGGGFSLDSGSVIGNFHFLRGCENAIRPGIAEQNALFRESIFWGGENARKMQWSKMWLCVNNRVAIHSVETAGTCQLPDIVVNAIFYTKLQNVGFPEENADFSVRIFPSDFAICFFIFLRGT